MSTTPLCPICNKQATPESKPFCSPRCRDVDLAKWFSGSYAVPAVELDDVDAESNASASDAASEDIK